MSAGEIQALLAGACLALVVAALFIVALEDRNNVTSARQRRNAKRARQRERMRDKERRAEHKARLRRLATN